MFSKVLILALAIHVVLSDNPQYESQEPAKYTFKYAVDDADVNYNHGESRDGDAIEGSYSVKLPDSRVQNVVYTVDGDSGYVAEVTYDGVAQYPEEPAQDKPNYG